MFVKLSNIKSVALGFKLDLIPQIYAAYFDSSIANLKFQNIPRKLDGRSRQVTGRFCLVC